MRECVAPHRNQHSVRHARTQVPRVATSYISKEHSHPLLIESNGLLSVRASKYPASHLTIPRLAASVQPCVGAPSRSTIVCSSSKATVARACAQRCSASHLTELVVYKTLHLLLPKKGAKNNMRVTTHVYNVFAKRRSHTWSCRLRTQDRMRGLKMRYKDMNRMKSRQHDLWPHQHLP